VAHAAAQDYAGFYEEEILYREMSDYPPAAHMLAVQIYGKSEDNAKQLADRLAAVVKCESKTVCIGPAPANISKINDIFRFVFYIKDKEYDKLVEVKNILEERVKALKPTESVQFDFDPVGAI
jgi:primosomal protein N' (replication factor Y)